MYCSIKHAGVLDDSRHGMALHGLVSSPVARDVVD